MTRHCDTAIVAARPRKPKDKAKVEAAVLLVERWIVAKLFNPLPDWTCRGLIALPLVAFNAAAETNYALPAGLAKPIPGGGLKRRDEFRQDAVRIALISGLTLKQVAADPLPGRVLRSNVPKGGGMSTLNKWITAHRDTDVMSKEDLELAKENDRL